MLNWNELKYVARKTAAEGPGAMDKALAMGEEYGPSMGVGAAGGAVAGIPVALLAHALMADKKNKGLRSYLKSSLLGALIGGGLGAAGGAAAKHQGHDLMQLLSSMSDPAKGTFERNPDRDQTAEVDAAMRDTLSLRPGI